MNRSAGPMTAASVAARSEHVIAVRATPDADTTAVKRALVEVREIRAWADASEAALIARLDGLVSFPEAAIAEATKCSLGQANRTRERAGTLANSPAFAAALDHGQVTSGHVDAVTRSLKRLDADQRDEFLERADDLVHLAAAGTTDQFAKRLNDEVKRIRRDDGESRLARQKRNTRLSTWTDGDGMWNLRGTFDPELAVKMSAHVDTTVGALFAEHTPEFCPDDPVEKNKFLAAHALARIVHGTAGTARSGRPEYVAVIDADAPNEPGPVAEFAIPIELPARIIAELAQDADIAGVVVRNGVVLHAPGELDLGRSTRLASRYQRRALRALYRNCAIPGCSVGYDRCKLHHIVWWRDGGRTNLANLLPVCSRHHSKIHNDAWIIELGPRRELTLRLPDGQIHNTGPPSRRAT